MAYVFYNPNPAGKFTSDCVESLGENLRLSYITLKGGMLNGCFQRVNIYE